MIKFCAINEKADKQSLKSDTSSSTDQNESDKIIKPQNEVFSKEKEEFRIMNLYKKALEYQMKSEFTELIDSLEEILTSSIIKEKDLVVQLQVVKAASFKLLANTYRKLNDFDSSYLFYQMAIQLNQQDVNLWYGIGVVCEKLKYWEKAVISYENVLKLSDHHWPSLDSLVILTFALSDFEKCIDLCERTLYLDNHYEAAIYVLQKIFALEPYLKTIYKKFLDEMPHICTQEVDTSISLKISERVELIRADIQEKRLEQQLKDKIETINFKNPLKTLSWESLTKSVLKLFQHLKETNKLESIINMSSLLHESQVIDVVVDEEKVDEKDYEIIEENETVDCTSNFNIQKNPINVNRITRNSSQLFDRCEEPVQMKHECYLAQLLRMNILNEVHEMASQQFNAYMSLVSNKREVAHPNKTFNCCNYKAKSLNDCNKEVLIKFIQSFDGKKMTIIAIGLQLVYQLIRKEYMIWSSELIDDYMALASLVKIHVSSYCNETPAETILSIKRALFDFELLIDRKQSELEGKTYKRQLQFSDFLSSQELEEISEKIMKIQIFHEREFESDLNKIQIRILWLKYILADLAQNEDDSRITLDCIKRCIVDNDIPVTLRPNCVHHSLITIKKIDDNLSASFKSLKIDVLNTMYLNEEYDRIIDKTNLVIGTVILPRDDYADDINNYLVQISFNCASYHRKLLSMLQLPTTNATDTNKEQLVVIYMDICAVLEEITNLMEILVDPKKKNRSPLTGKQLGFLTENYFKVGDMIMTNAANFLKYLQLNSGLELIDIIGVGSVARFILLAKEYFYYMFYHKITTINAAHVWCLYEHFKRLELHDSMKFNQSVTYNPSEEFDLPPSLNFLSLVHEFLGFTNKCGQDNGSILKFILTAASEYMEEIRPKYLKSKFYVANQGDVYSLLDQTVFCIRPVLRPNIDKSRKPLDHGSTEKSEINLDLVELMFPYLQPERIPEIDSVKNLSISTELNNLLLEVIDLLPESIFENAYSEKQIKDTIESESSLSFAMLHPCKYSKLFYFIADHYFKNNEFEKAFEYYIKNLRFTPVCFDSWAGIALIYYKRFELKFNMMDSNSETLDNEEVMKCLNCFNHAISLDPENLTILIERACFCYEVHSYASRIIKKSMTRDIRESFIKVCEILATTMLELAKESYQMALDSDNYRDKEEKWLYHYMLSKCMEKSDDNTIIEVLDNLKKSMASLDKCGARYVRKVVIYTKIPYRAVEVVEVYYKYHASILKCLIKNQINLLNNGNQTNTRNINLKDRTFKKIDHKTLLEIQQRLISMNQSPFIVNVGKKKCAKKRVYPKQDDYPEPSKVYRETPSPDNINNSAEFPIDIYNIPPELRYEDVDDDCIIQEIILPNQPEDIQSVFERCVDLCKTAMEIVLQRLPLHYKAMYHLANIYYCVPHLKDLEKSYEYLMGSSKTGKSTINGLFKDRKSSNFFSGVWRIPVADIDRYGSFAYHMYRSMNLLLAVLRQLNNWNDLILLIVTLRKTAASDKKGFLSDADRQVLLRKSMGHALCSLTEWLMKSKDEVSKTDLLAIHTLYYLSMKQSQGIDKMRIILVEAFNRCPIAKDMCKQMGSISSDSNSANESKAGEKNDRSFSSVQNIDKVISSLRDGKK